MYRIGYNKRDFEYSLMNEVDMKSRNKNSRSVLSAGILFFLVLIASVWAGAAETYHLKDGRQGRRSIRAMAAGIFLPYRKSRN